jgi:protocatechuate 3,4-dioxygenase beta subunit
MGRGCRNIVRYLATGLVILSLAERGRAGAGDELRKEGRLEILVGDGTNNRTLSAARVDIRRLDGSLCGRAISDANGMAWIRLVPGKYQVFNAAHEGYAYEGVRPVIAIDPGGRQRFVMPLTPNLHGVVRDPRGVPVAGTWISLLGGGGDEVISDGQGRFEIAWNRRCQFRGASAFQFVARQAVSQLAATVTVRGEARTLEVTLQPCPPVRGRIVDPNGEGISGAWVYATMNVADWGDVALGDEQMQADSEGRFEIPAVLPGMEYTIQAHADQYGNGSKSFDVTTVSAGALDIGSLTLPRADRSVAGRVVDAQGYPVVSAMVFGWGEGQPSKLSTQTDAEGRFTLAGVCAGRIDLRVDADWGGGNRLQAHVLARAGDTDVQITPLHQFSEQGGGAAVASSPAPAAE